MRKNSSFGYVNAFLSEFFEADRVNPLQALYDASSSFSQLHPNCTANSSHLLLPFSTTGFISVFCTCRFNFLSLLKLTE
jgi:hypothetical protein